MASKKKKSIGIGVFPPFFPVDLLKYFLNILYRRFILVYYACLLRHMRVCYSSRIARRGRYTTKSIPRSVCRRQAFQRTVFRAHFFVDGDVRENGVHPPGLREHRAERQRESGHQQPRSRRTYVREHVYAGHPTVEAQEYDAAVRQHGSDDYQIVQVWAGHFYVPETRGHGCVIIVRCRVSRIMTDNIQRSNSVHKPYFYRLSILSIGLYVHV